LQRVAAIALYIEANRRQQGQLSRCGGVIRSHFGLLLSEACGTKCITVRQKYKRRQQTVKELQNILPVIKAKFSGQDLVLDILKQASSEIREVPLHKAHKKCEIKVLTIHHLCKHLCKPFIFIQLRPTSN
jgi:hypothetical protein